MSSRLKLPRVPQKVIDTFTSEQTEKLINSLDRRTQTGFRDYIIILLLFDTGIRLSELTNLKIEDIDFGQSCLLINVGPCKTLCKIKSYYLGGD